MSALALCEIDELRNYESPYLIFVDQIKNALLTDIKSTTHSL